MFIKKSLTLSLLISSLILSALFISSCGDDDDNGDNCEVTFLAQTATGEFMGSSFTMVEGTAVEDFADANNFRIVLYGETVTGDACDNFNFDKPTSSIIFSIPKLVGSYNLGIAAGNTVTFNDASIPNEVDATIAVCGGVEISSVTGTTVTGKIDADGDANSYLNGNFTVQLCQ
jgi:hypothetical protein